MKLQQQQPSAYASSIATSMTIEEMRALHRQALSEADAKQMELRLVLASRYRELVGSSDEVQHMRDRAKELDDLVQALPQLFEKILLSSTSDTSGAGREEEKQKEETSPETSDEQVILRVRHDLASMPRIIHRSLDKKDAHGAATGLIDLFNLIASQTDQFPLVNKLAALDGGLGLVPTKSVAHDPLVYAQLKMVYLHVQTLPARTVQIARSLLLQSAGSIPHNGGAHLSASALSSLDLLDIHETKSSRAIKLIDLYYDSKAKLIQGLLNRLTSPAHNKAGVGAGDNDDVSTRSFGSKINAAAPDTATTAEEILSRIVLILQHDIILYPYQIFVLKKISCHGNNADAVKVIMDSLPEFDVQILQSKASHFLAAHLPLIRTKVKSVLKSIAGTTASALGQIRQSLYDKTDGVDCMKSLDANGVCTWDEAVAAIIDVRIVTHGTSLSQGTDVPRIAPSSSTSQQSQSSNRFSLWSALFSNTFSSLVHSLLTSAFHSVHMRVVSTLRNSLANAPPLTSILPHEAYRNTLRIATELDAALLKVSDDAHELLVHAEEREESERRLRQSLYVQTCEIMGRLLSELRRMLLITSNADDADGLATATKELIVGRLCHLMKFRLTSLATLLDPNSSPAVLASSMSTAAQASGMGVGGGIGGVIGGKSGMITLLELRSAFDISDDDDDGLISFEEAMEAMSSAFSGTQFHGAAMVRDTLLLHSSSSSTATNSTTSASKGATGVGELSSSGNSSPQNVTLSELALLSARGLRHDVSGPESALGTIQRSLDDIVSTCFGKWAKVVLGPQTLGMQTSMLEFAETARSVSEAEWKRRFDLTGNEIDGSKSVGHVSPHIVGYILSVASILNRSVCPSDALPPVPNTKYAAAMGICCDSGGFESIPNMMRTIRWALLVETLSRLSASLEEKTDDDSDATLVDIRKFCTPANIQSLSDVMFIKDAFFRRNCHGFPTEIAKIADYDDEEEIEISKVEASRVILEEMVNALTSRLAECTILNMDDTYREIEETHQMAAMACDLYFSSLFGDDVSASAQSMLTGDGHLAPSQLGASSDSPALSHNPLPSSRRFVLLPIQSERSLNELQLRSKYGIDKKKQAEAREDTTAASAVSSGFGLLSSMFKKN